MQFSVGERVWAKYEHVFYAAHILDVQEVESGEFSYYIHYDGFSKHHDEALPANKLMKRNKENDKYAKKLRSQAIKDAKEQKEAESLEQQGKHKQATTATGFFLSLPFFLTCFYTLR